MPKRGRRTPGASQMGPPPRRVRRPGLLVAVLGLVSLAGVLLLGYAVTSYFGERDWHMVASVDGVPITRAQLRDRVAVVRALQRLVLERTAGAAPGQVTALQRDFGGDPIEIARAQLIDEMLLAAEAKRRGFQLPSPNVDAELAEAINGRASVEVRWLRLVLGTHSDEAIQVATTAVNAALATGSTVDVARASVDGAWDVEAHDAWLGSAGPEPPGVDQPPATVVIAARSAATVTVLPAGHDGMGHLILAAVAAIKPGPTIGQALGDEMRNQGVSDGALASWASGAVLRRAVGDALLVDWRDTGADQVRLAELVLGPVSPGPASVELSGLVLARLGPGDPATKGQELQAELIGLPTAARADRFAAYVADANAGPAPGPLERSGEIGWFPRNALVADLGTAAFENGRSAGDVIGPISTTVGPELFLLEARYGQALDERAAAIAIEARAPGADLGAIARRVAPDDAVRATGGPWRARAEFEAMARDEAGLDSALVGGLLGPIDIEGQVVLARLLERRTGPISERSSANLELNGLGTWLADRLAAAVITTDPDPLGLGTPMPSSSAEAETPGAPVQTVEPVPSAGGLPFATPYLPTLPLP